MFDSQEVANIRQAIPAEHVIKKIEADDFQLGIHVRNTSTHRASTVLVPKQDAPTTVNWLVMFPNDARKLQQQLTADEV